jgi:hypothetical protein
MEKHSKSAKIGNIHETKEFHGLGKAGEKFIAEKLFNYGPHVKCRTVSEIG